MSGEIARLGSAFFLVRRPGADLRKPSAEVTSSEFHHGKNLRPPVGKSVSRSTARRLHGLPEKRMVGVAPAVVAHRRPNIFGQSIEIADKIFDRFRREVGFAFKRLIQIRDIRLMMLVMMDFHRLCIDVRLERVVGVG